MHVSEAQLFLWANLVQNTLERFVRLITKLVTKEQVFSIVRLFFGRGGICQSLGSFSLLLLHKVLEHLLRLVQRDLNVFILSLGCLHLLNKLNNILVKMSILVRQALKLALAVLTAGAAVLTQLETLVLCLVGAIAFGGLLFEQSFHFIINNGTNIRIAPEVAKCNCPARSNAEELEADAGGGQTRRTESSDGDAQTGVPTEGLPAGSGAREPRC